MSEATHNDELAAEREAGKRTRRGMLFAVGFFVAAVTAVAEATLANVIADETTRRWTLISVFCLAVGLLGTFALWTRTPSKLAAAQGRLETITRRLSPRREWGRVAADIVLSAVVATGISLLVDGLVPTAPWEVEAGVAALTFLSVLALVPHLSRYGRMELYGKLDQISAQAGGPGHSVIMEVLERSLAGFSETLVGLKSENGHAMDRADIIAWTLRCFENAHGRYRGVDSNLPSIYRERYPTYLESHSNMLKRLNRQTALRDPGERILVATTEPLRHDRVDNRQVFDNFLDWHDAAGSTDNEIPVPLNCVTPDQANAAAEKQKLPTTDVALWEGEFALLFKATENEDQQIVRMCFADDKDLYARCVAYLDEMADVARPIKEVMNLFPPEMVEAWPAYVDEKTRQDALADLLPDLLDSYQQPRILDAAAGLGTETEWLLRKSYRDVVSNEIEPRFNARIRARLKRLGVPHQTTLYSYDWRELHRWFAPEVFPVVLLLGNSLCLVADEKDLRASLAALNAVMPIGGTLVVDERNWRYFYDNREKLLTDPLNAYQPPRAMYYGQSVSSIPVEIIDDGKQRIRLLFYHDGDVRDLDTARDPEHLIGEIDMFPIMAPTLPELLADAGFEIYREYADLKESAERNADATFYTYAARKMGVPG